MAILKLISSKEQAYGYRKLTIMLQRKHQLIINKNKVYSLCKHLGIERLKQNTQDNSHEIVSLQLQIIRM